MSKHNVPDKEKNHLDNLSPRKLKDFSPNIHEEDIVTNEPYLLDVFNSFDIIENIFNEKNEWLMELQHKNERSCDSDDSKKNTKIIQEIKRNQKKEIEIAQEWEIKELKYGTNRYQNKCLFYWRKPFLQYRSSLNGGIKLSLLYKHGEVVSCG
ncbi:hypothetical protein MERGE_002712 [Pneumocystis wakefieldiae]|uniref:Uncharacterized protein n=1 Tax=Pneumocystis wakefieldiae TaxID=38082 RepID=A0A899FZI3_9ASCO|nr:hypothetical protein MERGE_002712 [Pneumocystis wakefieldiae]